MKIAVAMSGGVDSSLTAALLRQEGHEVVGITMRLFPSADEVPAPVRDAAAVAQHLGIPHHVADFDTPFGEQVIADFIEQYRCGRTPNPCVRCNRHIKFGLLLDMARSLGAERLATGHYVRSTRDPDGTCHLKMARNRAKDQSYFLYTLTQERLRQLVFPLGEMESKDEVRRRAREFSLPVAEKSDSQEVCFIPGDDYVAFLEERAGVNGARGDVVHVDGRVIGRHAGTHRYTIGQRRGLGIAWSEPLYVTEIDAARNLIVVGEEHHTYAGGLIAAEMNWIMPPDRSVFTGSCKIRYRHQPVPCRAEVRDDGSCQVLFETPRKAITPGQALVFYNGDEVLGGGTIITPLP